MPIKHQSTNIAYRRRSLSHICPLCGGTGKVCQDQDEMRASTSVTEERACPLCDGVGTVDLYVRPGRSYRLRPKSLRLGTPRRGGGGRPNEF